MRDHVWRLQVAQRQFILVSKVLQNLANDTLPGAKEAYMEQLNSFIVTNKAGLERFYQKVLSGTDRGKPGESEVPTKARQASLIHLHRYLSSNLQTIEQDMREDGGSEELIADLKEVLAQLGDDTNV
jgi:neurofibromin 1